MSVAEVIDTDPDRDWEAEAAQRANRAAEAKRIFESDIVQEFMENSRARCWTKFRESGLTPADDIVRLRLRIWMDVLDAFGQHFAEYESDATLAKSELETFDEKRRREGVQELARYGL